MLRSDLVLKLEEVISELFTELDKRPIMDDKNEFPDSSSSKIMAAIGNLRKASEALQEIKE